MDKKFKLSAENTGGKYKCSDSELYCKVNTNSGNNSLLGLVPGQDALIWPTALNRLNYHTVTSRSGCPIPQLEPLVSPSLTHTHTHRHARTHALTHFRLLDEPQQPAKLCHAAPS